MKSHLITITIMGLLGALFYGAVTQNAFVLLVMMGIFVSLISLFLYLLIHTFVEASLR